MTHIWITELFNSWKGLALSPRPPTHCGNFLSSVYPDNTWIPPVMEHSFSPALSSSMTGLFLESKRKFCIPWANRPLLNFYVLDLCPLHKTHTEWICRPLHKTAFQMFADSSYNPLEKSSPQASCFGSHNDTGAVASILAHLNRPS